MQFLAPPCRCCCTACRFKRQARARQALIWDVHNSHVAVAAALQTKTYHMAEAEDNVLEKAEGTKIEWAAGKNPTVKVRCCCCCQQESLNWGKKCACLDSLHPPASFRLIRHQITNNHHVLGDEIHLPYVVVLYNYAAPAQLRAGSRHSALRQPPMFPWRAARCSGGGHNTHLYARFLSSQPRGSCFAPRQVMEKKPKKLLCSQR